MDENLDAGDGDGDDDGIWVQSESTDKDSDWDYNDNEDGSTDQKAMSMYGSVYHQPRTDASREPLLRSTLGQSIYSQAGFLYNDPLNSTMGQSWYGQGGFSNNNDPLNKSKEFDVFGPSNMAQTIESKQEPITYPFKPSTNSVEEKGNALDGKSYMDELFMKDPTLVKKSNETGKKSPTRKAKREEPKNGKSPKQKGPSSVVQPLENKQEPDTYPFKPPINSTEEKGNALDGKSYMDELFMKDPTLVKKSNETGKKSPTRKAKREEPKNGKSPKQKAPNVKKNEKKEPPHGTKPKKLEKEKQSKPNGSKIKEKEKANANLHINKTSPDEMRI
ncbi:unnamed protein product [Heligmosomoides polygyrus]|uniref:Uncharacterized protein n=1 Tax=Heligmosomoides polygyrus TaxID=6339 RepID=A0A3P8AIN4_HELPZ|nr:unnamed protein product [Heligmosomoides polygyrus]